MPSVRAELVDGRIIVVQTRPFPGLAIRSKDSNSVWYAGEQKINHDRAESRSMPCEAGAGATRSISTAGRHWDLTMRAPA
jgi:hypothetical protein